MAEVDVKDDRLHPPGNVPRGLRARLLIGVSALILIASFCSRTRAPRTQQQAPPNGFLPQSADPRTVEQFEQELKKRRDELDAQKKQLNEAIAAAAPSAKEAPVERTTPIDPDEVEERRRLRRAPYAPVRVPVPPMPPSQTNLGQHKNLTLTADRPPAVNRESGKKIPGREGDLYRVYEGTILEAVLGTRLDGSFAGPVLARITTPAYSADGVTKLIPEGATVIGEAKPVDAVGQQRLVVEFHRLILPDGYSIDLDKVPGLSQIGETGLKDKTDNHYLRLLALSGPIGFLGGLTLGGAHAGIDGTGWDVFRDGAASSFGRSAAEILNRYSSILPTITIREGQLLKLYVTRDLLLPEYRP